MARPSVWDRTARPLGDKGMSPHAICVHPMPTSRPGTRPVLGTSFCLGGLEVLRSQGPQGSPGQRDNRKPSWPCQGLSWGAPGGDLFTVNRP